MPTAARHLYFESIRLNDELPALSKIAVDRVQMARFAIASNDYNPAYLDEQYARAHNLPSTFAPGILAMGFMGQMVNEWLRGGRLLKLTSRFVKVIWPGDVVTCRGRVIDRRIEENGKYFIDLDVWAENQKGELILRGQATAQFFYNSEDETRQRTGQTPLVVTKAQEEARLARLSRSARNQNLNPLRAVPSLVKGPVPASQKPAKVEATVAVSANRHARKPHRASRALKGKRMSRVKPAKMSKQVTRKVSRKR
jgi:acyl dehydratase